MRREYNIPKGIIRVSSITLDRAAIAVPYDMRNGFAVEMKVAITVFDYSSEFLRDTPREEDPNQILTYESDHNSVSIRTRKNGSSNAYAQFRSLLTDTSPHIIKASNQYNYNGENYRLNFDGSDKSVSWKTGTPGNYWGYATTAYIASRNNSIAPIVLYYCKLYDRWGTNGLENVVNDLVPVGNIETGEGGLLDLLTGELYWNINEGGQITYNL